ncbi:MAG: hypothetical protein FJ146_09445 [Deltaproteobacteria bacterium]|nr:hypothetical protein [Deltaproteobacteria bacterium]
MITVIILLAGITHCRGIDKSDADRSDLKAEKLWYDPSGTVQSCERQPATCPVSMGDPRLFIDTCVKQGFQAKSCGCLVLCTGVIKGLQLTDANVVQEQQQAKSKTVCAAADQGVIHDTKALRRPGTSLDRCLTSHVCHGRLGLCSGSDLATSQRLRDMARRGCADAVLSAFCPNEFHDTFACPEKSVQHLSSVWTDLKQKDDAPKRCMRHVICSDRNTGCDQVGLRQALEIKKVVDQPGCTYWLRVFCAVGSQSW